MNERGMLEWTDLVRGFKTLIKKRKPIARTVVALLKHKEGDRLSLGAMVERAATEYPDRIAVKFADRTITYATLSEQASRMANELVAAGLRPGDAVAIFMENRPELLAAIVAVAKTGGVAAMLNTNQRQHVLVHSIGCCDARFFIIGQELIEPFEEIRSQLGSIHERGLYMIPDNNSAEIQYNDSTKSHRYIYTDNYTDLQAAAQNQSTTAPRAMADIKLGDPCFYIFTSGTTGLPKASIMSHLRWLKAGAVFGNTCLDLQPGETIYAPLPLYHNQALTVGWSTAVVRGAAIALRRKFSASGFWDDCRRFDASAFVYIGEVPRYLLNQPANPADQDHGVRKMVGVGLRPDIWRSFKERFGIEEIYELYAASEMNVAFINAMNLDCTVGFCPLPWALIAFDVDAGEPVRDARGRFVRVGKGEVGLLISKVSDRFKFEGYTDPQASERKLFREVFKRGDVWYNSGDLMRDIGFGHLQFVDRVGDTFRWKSENVSTGEVEHVLNAMDTIAESTVYGVEIPGTVGRAGMAAVVPADATRPIDLQALLASLHSELPGYAIPVFVRVTDTLEVTGTFKHRKVELRKEGYDPSVSDDPIFVLLPGAGEYCRLTADTYAAIQAEKHRF